MTTVRLTVDGMHCASCVRRIENEMAGHGGVSDVRVNLMARTVEASFSGSHAEQGEARLGSWLTDLGFPPVAEQPVPHGTKDASVTHEDPILNFRSWCKLGKVEHWENLRPYLACLLSLPLVLPMAGAMMGRQWTLSPLVQLILSALVLFGCGSPLFKQAASALRSRAANMDVLVVLGTTAAFSLSLYLMLRPQGAHGHELYFETAAVVAALVLLGRNLEGRARRRAIGDVDALRHLRTEQVTVVSRNQTQLVHVSDLSVGDIVRIRPGEAVPVDGTILTGEGYVNESALTGESLPREVGPGDMLRAGALNGTTVLDVDTQAVGEASTLGRLIKSIESAQATKAPIQRQVDRIAAVFVPVVLVIAALALLGALAAGLPVEQAILNGVAVLVIACPCALGLATPAAVVVGIGTAARNGIMVRDASSLEVGGQIDTVVFDKTGTLTEGHPTLTSVLTPNPTPTATAPAMRDHALGLAASLQRSSEHPLAGAIIQAAEERGLEATEVQAFQALPGRGVTGQVAGMELVLGREALCVNDDTDPALLDAARRAQQEGHTLVWLAQRATPTEGLQTLAAFALLDTVRAGARQAVKDLKAAGLEVWVLSGDNPNATRAVCRHVGIERFEAGLLPHEKSERIQTLAEEGRRVAMVGDGINDAPAMVAANLGIAMASGTDLAIETAHMTLMRNEPTLVGAALNLARTTSRIIRQNLFWAFAYNTVGIPLAAFGLLSPMVAGAAMALSSISVVGNALRLQRWSAPLSPRDDEGTGR